MGESGATQAGNQRRIQVRAPLPNAFTDAKKQVFLDHLAGCANIRRAAAAAGVLEGTVHNHRRRNAVFAAQCAEALEAGYESLEASVLERAAGGYVPGPDADGVPGPESLDAILTLQLLAIRKAKGACRTSHGPPPRRATDAELNESILAKLDVLDQRLAAGRPVGSRGRKKGSAA